MMTTLSSPSEMWQAVVSRDPRADSQFVFAVSSTGIYCRPSCPSRRPRRDRVSFFDTPAAAVNAGFRACRRCRPDAAAPTDRWPERIERACALLTQPRRMPLASVARRLGTSAYHFQRNFKRLVGLTPRQYAEAARLGAVKRQLRGQADITGAMLDAGYASSSGFYERAVPRLGMTPSAYKQGGRGMSIVYATVTSPLGRVLVAATARGVCTVEIGSSSADLIAALTREFPHAQVRRDQTGLLAAATGQIVAHMKSGEPRLTIPLDIRATAFQWRVWNALADIPYGQTRTYGEIAAAIGAPRASRAVARACAANRAALVIPCHRVVPAGGGTGGYRWGASRKRRLLALEKDRQET